MTQKELEALMHFVQDAVDVILLSTIELSKKDPTFLESLISGYDEATGEGIYLIEGFTGKQRRLDVEKAFKIIAKERSKNENH